MGRNGVRGGREYGAEGSLGRKGACVHTWGGQERGARVLGAPSSLGRQAAWGAREPGAELEGSLSREVGAPGSLERKGAWGGRDPQWAGREAATGAGRGLGRKGVWGGREPGAGGSLGRKGACGGREPGAGGCLGRVFNAGRPLSAHPDTPTSTCTLKVRHFSARREASTLFSSAKEKSEGVAKTKIWFQKQRNKTGLTHFVFILPKHRARPAISQSVRRSVNPASSIAASGDQSIPLRASQLRK